MGSRVMARSADAIGKRAEVSAANSRNGKANHGGRAAIIRSSGTAAKGKNEDGVKNRAAARRTTGLGAASSVTPMKAMASNRDRTMAARKEVSSAVRLAVLKSRVGKIVEKVAGAGVEWDRENRPARAVSGNMKNGE
jgi:hypothetical protein